MKESNPSDTTVAAADPSKAGNDGTIASTAIVEPTTTNNHNDGRMDNGTLELEKRSPSDANVADEEVPFASPDKETRKPGAVKVDGTDDTCRTAKDDGDEHISTPEMVPENEPAPPCARVEAKEDGESKKPGSATSVKQSTDDPRAASFKADVYARLFPQPYGPSAAQGAQPGSALVHDDGISDPAREVMVPDDERAPPSAPFPVKDDEEATKKPGSRNLIKQSTEDPRAAAFKADVYARLFSQQYGPAAAEAAQPGSTSVDGTLDHQAAAVSDLHDDEDTVSFHDNELQDPVFYGDDPDQTATFKDSRAILTAELVDDTDVEARIQEEIDQRMKDSAVIAEVVPDNEEKERRAKQTKLILAALLVLGIVLGAVLGSVLSKNEEEVPQLSDEELLLELLTPISGDAILNESTPQFEAFQWMTYEDSAVLLGINSNTPSAVLIDRFVISLLFFATGGPDWFDKMNFLTNSSVCDWHSQQSKNCEYGVFCNSAGSVVRLSIGKCQMMFSCSSWRT